MIFLWYFCVFFFSSRRRHTRCALVTGVQTCALPILRKGVYEASRNIYAAHVTRAGGDNWEQKVWEDAVGYVLGGYKDANGVRLGGLGRYRGETIIQIGRASCRERVGQYV